MIGSENIDLAVQTSSTLLSYSDEAPELNTLIAGSIAGFTILTGAIFAFFASNVGSSTASSFVLTEEEQAVVVGINNVYDATEKERVLTEAGTVGETARKKKAAEARAAQGPARGPRPHAELRGDGPALSGDPAAHREPQGGPGVHGPGQRRGMEFLAPLTAMAKNFQGKAGRVPGYSPKIDLVTSDFTDEKLDVSEADVLFAYSSKYDANGIYLTELSQKLQECKSGAKIITIDRRLKGPFTLVRELDDPNGDLQRLRGYVFKRD
eukprot:CAMPEP_0194599318 /NCGR_PEP_ID=MMETSP0292-20121207/27593_1 /TAXON_ID=39354 /ORGANISM="Heterosigma akashiwo, Strain CCMP2393" /LENGTH=265 /DNA_ID=CAMNT_0039460567 /DNA_START=141 /DNA_END=938 /DNA_ORIENTATION=+